MTVATLTSVSGLAAITSVRGGWAVAILATGLAVQFADAIVRRRHRQTIRTLARETPIEGISMVPVHQRTARAVRSPLPALTRGRHFCATVGTPIIRWVPFLARASPAAVGAVAFGSSVLLLLSRPLACTLIVLALARHRRHARSADRARVDAIRDELSLTLDLLRVAVSAGLTVRQAITAVCGANGNHQGPAELAGLLSRAVDGVSRGERYVDAIAALPDQPVIGSELRLLSATLISTERFGTPPGPALAALAKDVRDLRRRLAEAEARRVPVRMLAPLVLLLLPSFALLTIAPLLAGGLSSLRLTH